MNYTFPADCGYAASKVGYGDVAWYKENGDLLNPETDRFVAGEKYRVLMTLVALDGYEFATSRLSATINAETASVSVNVPKFLVTVSTWYTCPVPSGTFTVSGTVTSFLSESDSVGIFLSKASGSFPYMQYKSGNTASYSFSNISAGSYILTVNKKNHVTRQYRLNVYGNTTVHAQINPIGDISGDGKVTAKDYAMANAHVQKISELTDYALKCGDVLKADGKITAADAARINSHVQKVDSLY